MFTGVIESISVVQAVQKKGSLMRLEIRTPFIAKQVRIGSSVAVNGVCLTVSKKTAQVLSFDVVSETLQRTTLGGFSKHDKVHLELPLKWQGRLEGHFVLGHVDGVGEISRVLGQGPQKSIQVRFSRSLKPFLLEKGSVAMDGVSLTLGKVSSEYFWVHLVPHTLKMTAFGGLKKGARVNLEADILIKSLRTLIDNPKNTR